MAENIFERDARRKREAIEEQSGGVPAPKKEIPYGQQSLGGKKLTAEEQMLQQKKLVEFLRNRKDY